MNAPAEESSLANRSWILRFCRWLFSWRILRRLLVATASVVTLIALAYVEENWRGKHAWEKFKREWEAKGERFDLASFIPKPVPPEQNFFATPFWDALDYERDPQTRQVTWKDTNGWRRTQQMDIYGPSPRKSVPSFGSLFKAELTDLRDWQRFYRGNTNFPSTAQPQDPARDVLLALSKFEPALAELREANRRPYAHFPVHYGEGFDALLPHLAALKGLSQVLRLRSTAFLEANQTADALNDIKLSLRLSQASQSEPLLISYLVQIAIDQITVNSIWEGLAKQRWNEAQLAELQKTLASMDLLADYLRAMRGERAFSNDLMDKLRRGRYPASALGPDDSAPGNIARTTAWAPSGFVYQNQLCINRMHQERTLQVIDAAKHRVYPERARELDNIPELRKTTPYNILARMLFPALAKTAHKASHAQAVLDLATTACALERYRLAHGQFPDAIEALVPRFLAKAPIDVINGEPLKYHRTADGQFLLYSVGWNEKDDGGEVSLTKGKPPGPDFMRGDWVWRYPVK
ncbi:MAG: hypothetical protein HYY23_09505 [Verrucomicrobia bacterium]|nr:hypothetical protein [Verrucomicrobiota bacterium]